MRYVLLLAVVITSLTYAFCGDNLQSKYIHYESKRGAVFFIKEQRLEPCPGIKVAPLKFDYTYVQEPDSVVVLSTLTLKEVIKPQHVTILYGDSIYSADLETIYIDSHKNDIEYRLKFSMPFDELKKIYQTSKPYVISYQFENRGSIIDYNFTSDYKKWCKTRTLMENIIAIIELNTK